ncbi:aminotransferase [Halobacteriales archaeon QS_3_64_16]|nr:MAG: aminotransferase [Halobacteriales archaeon QS_3_64_16]
MEIEPFSLEHWFDQYEHSADIMLAESGIRSLDSSEFDTDPGELGYVIPTDGDPEFKAEIAARYDRGPEEIAFTCGTQEANFLAFLAAMDEGSHAVVVTPTYQSLQAVPDAVGEISRVCLEPPNWSLDVEKVKEEIRPETELIVINNPNNPTGQYHSQETIEALYDVVVANDAYLLCDEVYRLLADDPLPLVASMGEYGISTTSLTKAYGLAGLRFGWLCGPAELLEKARQWKDYTTISPSIFGQHVARQALEEEREANILARNRDLAARNRERVREFIAAHEHQGLSWHDPVGVNGFLTVPDGFGSAKSFCRQVVEEESIVLAPGECFAGPSGGSEEDGAESPSEASDLENYFRLGFGLPSAELAEGLSRLGDFLERHY